MSAGLFLSRRKLFSMEDNQFFAMMARMKYIDRWALMRNTENESLSQHSFEVAVLAHALAILSNERHGTHYDPDHAAVLGLFHDSSEILTGDMPTPVKYYSRKIRGAYAEVEEEATEKLLHMLPKDLREVYRPILQYEKTEPEMKILVKAADKLSALIKCMEEKKAGNTEFSKAEDSTLAAIHDLHFPAAEDFLSEFLEPYSMTLDQLQ